MIQIAATFAVLCFASAVFAQLPAKVTDLTTISGAEGTSLRYKTNQLCEKTEGVKSYSGYIDIAEDKHIFFWFFESRRNPSLDPVTMWLNGGPGADSLSGLFDELGPCRVNEDLSLDVNPHSWNEVSNMLFLTQPVGVGFSYGTKVEVDIDLASSTNGTEDETVQARYANADYLSINSTKVAAVDAWKAVQTFYESLPELNPNISSKTFHLATQSYGGHWGPVFFNHFRKQNKLETNARSAHQVTLEIGTLLIVNGLIDYKTQAPAYPRFARNNTHGVELDETVVKYMETALHLEGQGCLDLIGSCEAAETTFDDASIADDMACNTASALCRNAVELVYIQNSPEQDPYDVRNHTLHPQPPGVFPLWLNTDGVQKAIGVDLNYTLPANLEVLASFWFSGDLVRSNSLADLSELLDAGLRVVLVHGDSDYVCNWYGGEDLSLAVNFTGAERFRQAGYAPMMADGKHYGDTREAGGFSFTRIFDAGHAAPFYQPEASLAIFNRSISDRVIATGNEEFHSGYATVGDEVSRYSQKEGDWH